MTPSFLTDRLVPALAVALLSACASGPREPKPAGSTAPSAATIRGDQIQASPGESIEKTLAARSPGVSLGRAPDGSLSVRIRGQTSLTGNNEPLYILDGSPFVPGAGGALTGINPYDIESIKVLKDPADLSMYGSRGASGVILIKTKQKNRN
jgi:TonB-dependent SusC/RagA subfamily outer membrane receptor